GNPCGYDITFPKDQLMLGEDHFTLDWPIRDDTNQKEQLMFWFCEQFGLPNMYRRYINMVVNGNVRFAIYDDVQQPDGSTIREFFPDDPDGDLVKTDCWDEFDDFGNPVGGQACLLNTLENFVTPTGEKKVARYRWNWRPRAVKRSAHDFSSFFSLIDAVTAQGSNAFVNAMMAQVDIDHWMRTFAMNDLASYWDGFGNPNSKNTYLYKPQNAGWKLFSWDFDVGLGTFGDPTDAPLFDAIGDPGINRIYATPTLVRPYWEALYEAVSTFFITGRGSAIETLLDSKYAAFKTNSIALSDPSSIKSWISARRIFLLSELKKVAAPFAISTNKIASYTNEQGVILLSGTAPPSVHTLLLNGRAYPAKWTSATNWVVEVALDPGTNTLTLEGRDRRGAQPTNAPSSAIQIIVPSAPDPARGQVVINEILFQPATPGSEFVEIFNRSARTTYDLSGWRLEGVSFVFPPGSVLRPGAFLVVVGDERVFGDAFGWNVSIAGEFPGKLNPNGESLRLVRPGVLAGEPDTLIDSVVYSSVTPWPWRSEDVGRSLELVDASRDRRRVGNWDSGHGAVSTDLYSLLSLNNVWRFQESGLDPGVGWQAAGFDDSAWPTGPGVFWNSTNVLLLPKGAPLRLTNSVTGARVVTHYFRTPLVLPWDPGLAELRLATALDDGGVFYVNEQEVLRRRMPLGAVGVKTLASQTVGNAILENAVSVTVTNLRAGTNIIAVEVHQVTVTNSDVVFGLELTLRQLARAGATPGAANRAAQSLPAFPDLWLSEVQPENLTGPTDASGKRPGWVELYNSGASELDLGGLFLSSNPGQLDSWMFPAGSKIAAGQFLLVWMDGRAGAAPDPDLHAGFVLPARDGIVLLSRSLPGRMEILDYLSYSGLSADESFGKYPADSPEKPQAFAYPTPRGQNDNTPKPVTLWINEWMASNASALADPLDGNFDDWFEIYNPAGESVDLAGFTLTDNLSQPTQFKVPSGFLAPPKGYLLVWADNQPGQNALGADLHVNFKLSGSGEAIGLFAKDGRRIDAVVFKSQTNDISQGRLPDGAPGPFAFFHHPTPRSRNIGDAGVPTIVEILEVFRDEQGAVVVKWHSETGRQYRLMAKDDLNDNAWRLVGAAVRATSGLSIQADPGASGVSHRFYRIEVDP
ncbi:MAG: lamin tail domain-containing protein, partial [Verrucomicrobia bacterium]|nr:lamin tail domain-containing protein [Verrucomicrobiota bacterium]